MTCKVPSDPSHAMTSDLSKGKALTSNTWRVRISRLPFLYQADEWTSKSDGFQTLSGSKMQVPSLSFSNQKHNSLEKASKPCSFFCLEGKYLLLKEVLQVLFSLWRTTMESSTTLHMTNIRQIALPLFLTAKGKQNNLFKPGVFTLYKTNKT